MTVLIVEKVRPGLRGYLSRWMLEPRTGVFVGTLSARVRDLVWTHTVEDIKSMKTNVHAGALLLFSAQNEQSYSVRSAGYPGRLPIDFDGLVLFAQPAKALIAPEGPSSTTGTAPTTDQPPNEK